MSADDRKAEELIGQPAEKLAPRQTVTDDLLGRPHTAEKSFAVDTRPAGETRFVTETPEERFAELQRMTSSYLDADDEAKLAKAFKFASEAHKGVCRKSGEPYIIHPVEVAIILADLRMDVETLIAALLHDTVEDTDVTDEIVTAEFGEHVDQLVDGVTKITRIEVDNLSDKQAATIRKMFVAMSRDIRVIVIKLADRLHNMRTLAALAEDRRIFKSRETLEIYAPIAHRLGINSIKWELEDLSFYYLEPNKYKQVARMVMESRAEREAYLEKVLTILRDEMDRVSIQAQVMGRPKHLYSIYQKMTKKGKGFSEIYDLIAVRLIVKTVKDCYSALGAVHTLGIRCRAASRTTSRCPSSTCTKACIPRSSVLRAIRSRCRSAPRRCTAWTSTASRPTGATRRAPASAATRRSTSSSHGCAKPSTGRTRRRTRASS